MIRFYIFTLLLLSCQCFTNAVMANSLARNRNLEERLIDGIENWGESSYFVSEYSFKLETYKYNETYIEHLKIEDLLDKTYRDGLIQEIGKFYGNEDHINALSISFLTELLILRMELLQDTHAFYILSELSKDGAMAHVGIELSAGQLANLFFKNPLFYLKESYKYRDTDIIETVIRNIGCLTERDLLRREGDFKAKTGMILIYAVRIDPLNDEIEAKKKIQSQSPIKITFTDANPRTHEKEKSTHFFYDLHLFLNDFIKNNLNGNELKFYREEIYPYFSNYEIHNYHVQDQDGYVNIRQEANASSPIKGIIRDGEPVSFYALDFKNPGWILIQYRDIYGYVHKSRLVRK